MGDVFSSTTTSEHVFLLFCELPLRALCDCCGSSCPFLAVRLVVLVRTLVQMQVTRLPFLVLTSATLSGINQCVSLRFHNTSRGAVVSHIRVYPSRQVGLRNERYFVLFMYVGHNGFCSSPLRSKQAFKDRVYLSTCCWFVVYWGWNPFMESLNFFSEVSTRCP